MNFCVEFYYGLMRFGCVLTCYLLGSKDLGFMYLESEIVLLANHDQNNVFKLF